GGGRPPAPAGRGRSGAGPGPAGAGPAPPAGAGAVPAVAAVAGAGGLAAGWASQGCPAQHQEGRDGEGPRHTVNSSGVLDTVFGRKMFPEVGNRGVVPNPFAAAPAGGRTGPEIGRASCRER